MATKPGTDNSWTEPESAANTDYQPIYPYNNVQVTESGHSFEMDDTPTRERVRLQHRSGTFIEMHPNGDEVHKVYGNGYEITIKDKNVLIKGGHLENEGRKVVNLLLDQYNKFHLIANQRIEIIDSGIKVNFHGTGCSLATAISCNIANGFDLVASTNKANKYIYKAIKNNLKIGGGSRVLKHF